MLKTFNTNTKTLTLLKTLILIFLTIVSVDKMNDSQLYFNILFSIIYNLYLSSMTIFPSMGCNLWDAILYEIYETLINV